MSNTMIRTGTVTGTGATLNIPLGFKPDYIKVTNGSDGESVYVTREMLDASSTINGIKILAISGVISVLTTAATGLSDYAGLESDGATLGIPKGFTIGAAATINIAAEELYWEAYSADGP